MTDTPPILRSGMLLQFQRFPDLKPVYVDPDAKVMIEPADYMDGDEGVAWTLIRGSGLSTVVKGDAHYVAVAIQRARNAMAEITLGALVEIVQEEVQGFGLGGDFVPRTDN